MSKKKQSKTTTKSLSKESSSLHLNGFSKESLKYCKMLKIQKDFINLAQTFEYLVAFHKENS